ncbi:hypothetical protein [Streptococcus danieliae]|uniref:hypothetical protein n=1 Tax=Streptococcus danieliae TaxID=747656 RepID=UPI0021CAA4CF|nr:hypothetical protein [Streptococcus danieliae]MCU0082715.1 hypothetical protein [Streptococcus danieliae]
MVYQFFSEFEYDEDVNGAVMSLILNGFVTKYSRELSCNYHEKSKDYRRPRAKTGLNKTEFYTELCAYIPEIQAFRQGEKINIDPDDYFSISILADSILFIFQNITDIKEIGRDFFSKDCYEFIDGTVKKSMFREEINQLLERNNLSYHLTIEGVFERKLDENFQFIIDFLMPDVEDGIDNLIEESKKLIASYEEKKRKLGLEKIIDAFQRTKSLYAQEQSHLKKSVERLVTNVAEEHVPFREFTNTIMKAITDLSNSAEIRHTERYQSALQSEKQRDYLYQITLLTVRLLIIGYKETEESIVES